jgi:primosomal protein N'
MSILNLGARSECRYLECRDCGTTVDSVDDPCSTCGSEHIAEYTL